MEKKSDNGDEGKQMGEVTAEDVEVKCMEISKRSVGQRDQGHKGEKEREKRS